MYNGYRFEFYKMTKILGNFSRQMLLLKFL